MRFTSDVSTSFHLVRPTILSAVCPACGKSIVLKGARLRTWLYAKDQNPKRKGPYCCYKCSSISNLRSSTAKTNEQLVSL